MRKIIEMEITFDVLQNCVRLGLLPHLQSVHGFMILLSTLRVVTAINDLQKLCKPPVPAAASLLLAKL